MRERNPWDQEREPNRLEHAITVPHALYMRLHQLALQQDTTVTEVTEHVVKAGLQVTEQPSRRW